MDPELLAAMCGPDGLGGEAVPAAFGQDRAADALRPGPLLAALTAQTASSPGSLTDNELIGVLQAARRMANLAAYQQTVAIAEFARRRQAEFEAAKARGVPVGCRDGEFPGEELTMELVATGPIPAPGSTRPSSWPPACRARWPAWRTADRPDQGLHYRVAHPQP